ncbi:MAG: hypothetical protein DMG32_26640, partial [Acidobacteria bacterium]
MSTRVQVPGFAAFTALAICCIRGRTRVHLFLLRITIANLRPFRFCWGGRFVSVFPCGGFGSLVVAGDLSRDCKTFYASRILSFHPERNFKQLQAPVRKITFYEDHAIYRDSRHRIEVLFDQASLPLSWDSSWNQWKHLLGAKVGV